jgi:hypothetical protein
VRNLNTHLAILQGGCLVLRLCKIMKTIGKIRIFTVVGVATVLLGLLAGCDQDQKDNPKPESARTMKTIDEVIKIYSDSLMTIPGVVGLYHGLDDSGRTCLKVMVKEKTPELERRIPEWIEGYPVVVEETGEIKPLEGH